MRKLLFIISRMHMPGGEPRSLSLLCNELARQEGFDITIALLESEDSVYPLNERINIINLVDHAKGRAARAMHLLKMIRHSGYHLVVSYGITARLPVFILGHFFSAPIIYCERTTDPFYKGFPIKKRLIQAAGVLIYRGKNVVFQSHDVIKYYKKTKRHTVIPNMLVADVLPDVNEWTARENTVISATRCVAEKNLSLLIKAFTGAVHLSYKLKIYGDGVLKPELMQLIKHCDTEEYISLKPANTNIFELMNNAKIYVCSSDLEGYPNALLEAMAMGMACISTNCSGSVKELIDDGANGLIVPVGDENAMTAALVRLMEDDAAAREMAARAIGVRQSNAKDRIIEQWIAFFEEVMVGDGSEIPLL